MSERVCIVGSINIDLVVAADRLPRPGETVLGGRFSVHDGGKGANQAVAAARAGATGSMVGAVGDDEYGQRAVAVLEAVGDDVPGGRRLEGAADGGALIAVRARGENAL